MTAAGVLHTSVFIAQESGRPLTESLIPEEVATSVITLAELNTGVLAGDFDALDAVAGLTVIRV